MSESANELSRLIKTRQLPAAAVEIEADEAERIALAKRFDLPKIHSLHSEVAFEEDGKAILGRGNLKALFLQNCAVSGEEFEVTIDEPLLLRFVEAGTIEPTLTDGDDAALGSTADIEIELTPDDCDEIEYTGESFDLGEAVAQSLGLAIDPYAEGPGADAARKAAGITGDDAPSGPLAEALKGLKRE